MALWLINYKIEEKLVTFKKKKKSHVNNMMDLNMFFQQIKKTKNSQTVSDGSEILSGGWVPVSST